jgi:AraC-like DNA-binding protein
MSDLAGYPSPTPELLLGSRPSGAGPFPISLARVPEHERPNMFREVFGRLGLRYEIKPSDDIPFEADLTLQPLRGLQFLLGRWQGSADRSSRDMLADGTDDDIGLIVNLGGPYLLSQGGQEIVLGDGDATLVSLADPCSFTHRPPGGMLALRCPRAQFSPLVAGLNDRHLRRIPCETQALRLLTDYIGVARNEQTIASGELQQLVVAHLRDLMALAIGATRDAAEAAQDRGLRAARLASIKQDIAENLDQDDLSVATLAVRHRCTPRFIQRLFETEGTTFTEYVLAQRLALAHRILTDPRRAGDKISAVAYDCGFGDVSYFNRVFRRRYDQAPSDVRAQSRQGGPVILM